MCHARRESATRFTRSACRGVSRVSRCHFSRCFSPAVSPGVVRWPGACKDRFVATAQQWIQGARPHTLPNAIAPVVAGVGAAARRG